MLCKFPVSSYCETFCQSFIWNFSHHCNIARKLGQLGPDLKQSYGSVKFAECKIKHFPATLADFLTNSVEKNTCYCCCCCFCKMINFPLLYGGQTFQTFLIWQGFCNKRLKSKKNMDVQHPKEANLYFVPIYIDSFWLDSSIYCVVSKQTIMSKCQ